jgi:hypothetical protein
VFCEDGSPEAVSKLRITGNWACQALEARKTIARGERSEPLVMEANRSIPGGAKGFFINIFRPSGAFIMQYPTRGSLHSPLATVFRRFAVIGISRRYSEF